MINEPTNKFVYKLDKHHIFDPISKEYMSLEVKEEDGKILLIFNEICHHFDKESKQYLGYKINYNYRLDILEEHK